jgi:small subunit ribosomal protein S17
METKNVQENKSRRRTLKGVVVSDKMKDTCTVKVERYYKHPKYKKFISSSKKYLAHNPGNTKKIGDQATIEECRPISRRKRFTVVA